MFSLSTVTEPAAEPVSLEDMKLHLRVGDDAEDDLIEGLTRAARRLTEKETNQRWVTQVLKLTLPHWPCGQPYAGWENAIALPVGPVASVDEVRYYDFAGTLQTLAGTGYQAWLDHGPPLVAPAPHAWWPALQPGRLPAVEVEYTAGVASDEVSEDAVALIKLVVGYWYEHRGDGEDATRLGLPPGAERLANMLSSRGYL